MRHISVVPTDTSSEEMKDIEWTFTVTVKTDARTGQPTMAEMRDLLGTMLAQVEGLRDDCGYDYEITNSEVDSDEE